MKTVLWIAPDIRVMGGISTVLQGWLTMGIGTRHRLFRVASHQDGSRPKKLARALFGLIQTAWILLRCQADIAHIHGGDTLSFRRKFFFFRLIRKISPGTRVLYHHHGAAFMAQYPALSRAWRLRIRETLESADRVVCLSDSWRRQLREIAPRGRYVLLPNGVVVPGEPVDHVLRNRPIQAIFLGLIGDRKGIFDLLAAVGFAIRAGVDIRLDVGGNGEVGRLRSAIEKFGLSDRVTYRGWVSGASKERMMAGADFLALPSYAEGMPMTLLEAMAFGLPVLSTPVGGIPELVRDGESGILVPPGDPTALAEGIRRLADPELRSDMGRVARETIQRRHDLAHVVNRLDELYESV